jgi:hypothetical protein
MGTELGIAREALKEGWDAADAEQEGFTATRIQSWLAKENEEQGDNALLELPRASRKRRLTITLKTMMKIKVKN